ncbi:MAG: 23S rRNA (guanosine(2251)-2'-O)-methyltransferase RlmB, partial [Acidimicrobiales bacterium]
EHALGGDQIEGRRAVVELLLAQRRPVRDIWISDALEESEIIAQIVELAQAANVPLRRIGRSRLDAEARTDAPQGVLAHAEPLSEESLDALAAAGHDGGSGPDGGSGVAPFLIVLDQITDPHNVGALLRTAECFGATGVVLGRHRSAHVTPTVAKAAAGAIEWLRFAVVPGIPGALAELARLGVWCVGLDPGAPTTMGDVVVAEGPVALVLGSEDHGLSRLARQRCDVLASIPRSGRIESLNVSAAGAVAMAEMARRRLSA